MTFLRLLSTLLASVTVFCTGCRLFAPVAVRPVTDPGLSPEKLSRLRSHLQQSSWRTNRHWSPLDEWTARAGRFPAVGRQRWITDPKSIEEFFNDSRSNQQDRKTSDSPKVSPQSVPIDRYLAALTERDDLSAWNAAILWAKRNPFAARRTEAILARLVGAPPTVRNPKTNEASKSGRKRTAGKPISTAMRAAATEAWCLVLTAGSNHPVDSLAPAAILAERQHNMPDIIRGELWRGIARRVAPVRIPLLEKTLAVSSDGKREPLELRRAAMESCLLYALGNRTPVDGPAEGSDRPQFDASLWPATLGNCRSDSDRAIRRQYGLWLAVVHHPDAIRILERQLTDSSIRVREAATVSLGRLGTDEARALLRKRAHHSAERVRMLAVRQLARWGAGEVEPFAHDRSFNVRRVVAESLVSYPESRSALMIHGFLTDANQQVQLAAVQAVQHWPDALALPLLYHGMRDAFQTTRMLCFNQVQKRLKIPVEYRFDAPTAARAKAVARLEHASGVPLGYWNRLRRDGLKQTSTTDGRHIDQIRADLGIVTDPSALPTSPAYFAALGRLKRLPESDVRILEEGLLEQTTDRSGVVVQEVLPELSAAYTALRDLENSDVLVRRRAAQTLSRLATQHSLSRLVVRLLGERLQHEPDPMVWMYAVSSVMRDGSNENVRIAQLALNQPWADIRALGCQYIARHGRREYALWLLHLGLLYDRSRKVQLAAIEAAGRCGNPIILDGIPAGPETDKATGERRSIRGLRPLMNDAHHDVRFAAVVSMTRLGDVAAASELERMSADPDATVRQTIVDAMGRSGRSRFVAPLIRLGWNESSDRVTRAVLASLNQLVPPEKRPRELLDVSTSHDKINVWANWLNRPHVSARRSTTERSAPIRPSVIEHHVFTNR